MDMDSDKIITMLCKLADSEELKVRANENSRFSVEDILEAARRGSGRTLEQSSNANFSQVAENDNSSWDNILSIASSCLEGLVSVGASSFPVSGIAGGIAEILRENIPPAENHIIRSHQGISFGDILGAIFTIFQVVFSRTWNYVFGNYQMSLNVRVAPVSTMLRMLPRNEQNTLTRRIRQIMEQNSVTTYENLAMHIEQDSSLVRRIILRHLVEYMDEDLSMQVTPLSNS